ncbi:MAG: ABC transporter ATP-binding protein/permease [Alphaproteobacteria bacterium]|nr:ABC transporter ATP-binding protein/permease [Alphaproteobacteria bacterium]
MQHLKPFLADLWSLARPYWFSEERWAARGLLAVIVAMNLGLVFVQVLFNRWQNDFYNALQEKDYEAFLYQLGYFCVLATVFIVIAVYQLYLNQMLQIHWRRWLTERYVDGWLGERAYYRMQLTDPGTDNPDQRIADDLRLFVARTLSLGLGLLSAVVTLLSFVGILWGLSGELVVPLGDGGITVPGYMVWVALVYAVVGTWLTHRIGQPLVGLNFQQERLEADFRYALVRLRENTEAIALYQGERDEAATLRERFAGLMANWWAIMKKQKQLTWFTAGYGQVAVIFPVLVAAPRYFAGSIQLGGLMQTASAFGQVQGSLSWFVEAYTQLADWKATVDRLTGFVAAVETARAAAQAGGPQTVAADGHAGLALSELTLALPDDRELLRIPAATLAEGEAVLLAGPSGSGKSTLFRALAGIWPFGQGRIARPAGARLLFLPQRPYLPIGKLRQVVAYPAADAADQQVAEALGAVGLPGLVGRLDAQENWALQLSPGEQQRIAIARALIYRPDYLFLDEATASLDEASEAALYRLLRERLPRVTLVSIAHRPSLRALHARHWRIVPRPAGPAELVAEAA